MKKILLLIISILSLALGACRQVQELSKDESIRELDAWVSQTEKESPAYSQVDWKRSYQHYTDLSDRCSGFEAQMTERDKKHLDDLKGRYLAMVTRGQARRLKEEAKHLYRQGKSFLQELGK